MPKQSLSNIYIFLVRHITALLSLRIQSSSTMLGTTFANEITNEKHNHMGRGTLGIEYAMNIALVYSLWAKTKTTM